MSTNRPFSERFSREADSNHQKYLASLEGAAVHYRLFKDAGCNIAILSNELDRNQWIGVTGSDQEMAAAIHWYGKSQQIDIVLDLAMPLNDQYPFQENVDLLSRRLIQLVDRFNHKLFDDMSPQTQEQSIGRLSLVNTLRHNVWHIGGLPEQPQLPDLLMR